MWSVSRGLSRLVPAVMCLLSWMGGVFGSCVRPSNRSDSPSCACEATWHAANVRDFEKRLFARTLEYNPSASVPARGEREPLVVHIGKTCGSSLQSFLGNNRVTHSSIHVHPVPLEAVAKYDKIIIAVRDPMARFVSAFNFQYEAQPHGWYRPLYTCFKTANSFAIGVDDRNECGQVARHILRMPPKQFAGHITSGLCYYLGGMIDILRDKQVFIVRTKYCERDAKSMMGWLGYPVLSPQMPKKQAEHTVKKFNASDTLKTHLSSEGVDNLKRYLEDEYRLLRAIVKLSVNRPNILE